MAPISSYPAFFPVNAVVLLEVDLEDFQVHCAGVLDTTLCKLRHPPIGKIWITTDFLPATISCKQLRTYGFDKRHDLSIFC